MSRPSFAAALLRGWAPVSFFVLLGLIVSLIITFIQPLKYSSTVRLLIGQDIGAEVDAYTASRSEERIAQNLATIIYTTTFFDQVLNAGFTIDEKTFPVDDYQRRKVWSHSVDASVASGTGLLKVTAYHVDVKQAEQMARAIAFVLTQHASEYTSGVSVHVRLIDAPLNSRWPVKPDIFANALAGAVLGGFAGSAYVLLQAERIRRRHQLIHEEV